MVGIIILSILSWVCLSSGQLTTWMQNAGDHSYTLQTAPEVVREIEFHLRGVDEKLAKLQELGQTIQTTLQKLNESQIGEYQKMFAYSTALLKKLDDRCGERAGSLENITRSLMNNQVLLSRILQKTTEGCKDRTSSGSGTAGCEDRIQAILQHLRSSHDNLTDLIRENKSNATNLLGLTKATPAVSCSMIASKKSGLYWLDPDRGRTTNAFQAYCDMETDHGGWTLAYTYTFNDYSHFGQVNNAVTPRPTWPIRWTSVVPYSTKAPISETVTGAIDFGLWHLIGSEILVKSNIANWMACRPIGDNGLVKGTNAFVSCRIIKRLVSTCAADVPTVLFWDHVGPMLRRITNEQFYFWDGSTSSIFPTHDSCGKTKSVSDFPSVSFPHGNIYLR